MRVRPVFLIFITLEVQASDEKLVCDYDEPCDGQFSNDIFVFQAILKPKFNIYDRLIYTLASGLCEDLRP